MTTLHNIIIILQRIGDSEHHIIFLPNGLDLDLGQNHFTLIPYFNQINNYLLAKYELQQTIKHIQQHHHIIKDTTNPIA